MDKLYAHITIMRKEDAKDSIMEIIRQYPEGAAIDDICEQIHMGEEQLNAILAEMVNSGLLKIKNGKYYLADIIESQTIYQDIVYSL